MALGTPRELLNTSGSMEVYARSIPATGRTRETIPYKDITKVTFDIESYPEFDLDLTAKHQIQIDYTAIEKRVLAHMMTTYETLTGSTAIPTETLSIDDIMAALKKVSAVDTAVHPCGYFDFPIYDQFRNVPFY